MVSMPDAARVGTSSSKAHWAAASQHAEQLAKPALAKHSPSLQVLDEQLPLHWISEQPAASWQADPSHGSAYNKGLQRPTQLPQAIKPGRSTGNPFADFDAHDDDAIEMPADYSQGPASMPATSAAAAAAYDEPDNKPSGQLHRGEDAVRHSHSSFSGPSAWDAVNASGPGDDASASVQV